MKICKTFNICKFAGFGLHLYYQRGPLQVLRKDRGYTLHSFLRICKDTPFRYNFTLLLLHVSLIYLYKRKTATQQTISYSRSTVKNLEKL